MRKDKNPSLLRKVLDAYIERWRAHKAMRILNKQEWSVEFLTALLVRAARSVGKLEMIITGPHGTQLTVRTPDTEAQVQGIYRDDSIFNHLDDEIKVNEFINSMRRV